MEPCAQGQPQNAGLGALPACLLPARLPASPRGNGQVWVRPAPGGAPALCVQPAGWPPFPECHHVLPHLSPQPLPVPVDHQQQRRGPRGAGPRGPRRVPGGLSPGEPGGGLAAARSGAHPGWCGGPGGALADQHRRVHLDGRGLAPLPGLGRLGRGRAPLSLLAGRLGGVRGEASAEPLETPRAVPVGRTEGRPARRVPPPGGLSAWTMLVMWLAALCRFLSVLLSVLKRRKVVESLPWALPLTLRRFLEGRASCSVRWCKGVECKIFRAQGHCFPAPCSLQRLRPQGFCFENKRRRAKSTRAEPGVRWAARPGPGTRGRLSPWLRTLRWLASAGRMKSRVLAARMGALCRLALAFSSFSFFCYPLAS